VKRLRIDLSEVAEFSNLSLAFYKAAKGKRARSSVQAFETHIESHLSRLSADILNEQLPYGRYREFTIYDPKKRLIHAASFEDRVFHHAFMNLAGPVLERAMVPTSYACRPGMGIHQAVQKVQKYLRCYPYYVKIDIDGYFPSISHALLLQTLARRFKGEDCEKQLRRILAVYEYQAGRGLPIGALTSQYFANYFLDGLDRSMASHRAIRAQLRYMDDIIWWVESKEAAYKTLDDIRAYIGGLQLQVKNNIQVQQSSKGVTYCGFRVLPGLIRLTRRRKNNFHNRRAHWERLYEQGAINAQELQQAYSAVESICAGCNSESWRNKQFALYQPPEV